MTQKLPFTKMQGLGNDFVVLEALSAPLPELRAHLPRLADRRFGVGCDQILVIRASERADFKMEVFNADGSEVEMCGNGIRCVAKFVHDHGLSANNPLRIETGRGVLTLHLTVTGGKAEWVRVDMGAPILEADRIPTTLAGATVVDVPYPDAATLAKVPDAAGLDPRMTCVSMGNPHVTLYCRDVAAIPLDVVGPLIEKASIFPRRINVHFVQVLSAGEVIMRTWERGSGITLACGTGACAVAVSGVLSGRTGRELLAHLPGGDLRLEWNEGDGKVYMTGPATEVYSGEWPG